MAARITVRFSATARRIGLRVDPVRGGIVLVQPHRARLQDVLSFTASRKDWIARHLTQMPDRVPFAHGLSLPIKGKIHVVRFLTGARGGVRREGREILVCGKPEHCARRFKDWLKAHAGAAIASAAHAKAQRLGRSVSRVTIRDTTSRWGSCSPGGGLSFSWRLILAPEHVLSYVIAHEVAHLKHMNHGPAFWQTVEELIAEDKVEVASARHWLRRNGAALHRYG